MARKRSQRKARRSSSVAAPPPADDAPARPKPPAAGKGHTSAPTLVIALRVATIARMVADGWPRALILQVVAKSQADEATKRAQHQHAAPEATKEEVLAAVPILWGDKQIPERTIDYYLTAARKQLAREAAEATAHPNRVQGEHFARVQAVYHKAISSGKLGTALRASDEIRRAARPPGLSPRREAFIRWIVRGKDGAEAYRLAFSLRKPEHAAAAASKLLARPVIAQAIAALRARAAENAQVTLEKHMHELAEIRDAAKAEGNHAAATAAEIARGRVAGFYVEQMRILPTGKMPESTVDVTRMSDEQLEALDKQLAPYRMPALPSGQQIAIVEPPPAAPAQPNGTNGAHA